MAGPSMSLPTEMPIELLVASQLQHVRELSTRGQHEEALAAAEALARSAPQNRDALYLIAANQRCLNRLTEALASLQQLEAHHPRYSLLHQERGHCYTVLRDAPRALAAFLQAVTLNPALAASWTMLERLYRLQGDQKKADAAAQQLAALKKLPPQIVRAGSLFSDGDLTAAENILRTYLRDAGNHVEALRLLGRIQQQQGAFDEAERLLEAAVKIAPDYRAAHLDYVRVLIDRQKYPPALNALETLLSREPGNRDCLALYAGASAGLGRHEPAIDAYRQLLVSSESPGFHLALGHSLQSLGSRQEAIDSFQAALAIRPNFGDAYWSLANLKTYRFSPDEIASMRAAEAAPATPPADRHHLCFALGKACEDQHDYAESWQFYERGNALKHSETRYLPETIEANTRQQIAVCTAQFFAARAGLGAPHPDPIFIVGLPRTGSTLLEQILASHSQVEATQELYDVPRIVVDLQRTEVQLPESQGDSREIQSDPALAASFFESATDRTQPEAPNPSRTSPGGTAQTRARHGVARLSRDGMPGTIHTESVPTRPALARRGGSLSPDVLAQSSDAENAPYPAVIASLAPGEFRALGERYINDTRPYRSNPTSKPFFIDKMPNNFRHVGLIQLILPNAKIIDIRREPMACCFSNFKQLFAAGQEFTYSIDHIARYYRTYLHLMRHWDAVLPGRILRVHYEDLVNNLDESVRRILQFCRLEFEPACLNFHKTARSIRTPSSEQVRQPITREPLDHWRNYAPWLSPLQDHLGDALTRYRE